MSHKHLATALEVGRNVYTELSQRKKSQAGLQPVSKVTMTKEIPSQSTCHGVYSLHFVPDSDFLAVGYGNGSIGLYGIHSGKLKSMLQTSVDGLPITCIRTCPSDSHILAAAGSDGALTLWNVVGGKRIDTIVQPNNEINALDYSPDGSMFATAGKDAHILVYHADTNALYLEIEPSDEESEDVVKAGHHQRVFALKFHPQHKDIFVTGGWDRSIKVWDLRTAGSVASVPGPYICGDAIDIQGSEILTGSWKAKDALQVWDMGSGKQSEQLTFGDGVTQFIYGARFCDGGRVIAAGGSGTNSTHILKRGSQEMLGVISGGSRPVQALDASRSGLVIASGGLGAKVNVAVLT